MTNPTTQEKPAVPDRRKVILLVDMDGVSARWDSGLRKKLLYYFSSEEIPHESEWREYFYEGNFDEKYHKIIDTIINREGFYRNLPPYPDAITCLKDVEANHLHWIEPFICTKPNSKYENQMCHSEKVSFVMEHLGPFWAERTILAPDKTIVQGDFLIDDHPNITGINPRPSWTQMLFDQPYNRDKFHPYRFQWSDWDNFLNMMRDAPLKSL